jgi:hypothetical protein
MIATLPNGAQNSVGETRVVSANSMSESACEGSKGGALDVLMKFNGGSWRFDFTVTFASPIDCTGKDGLAVRVKIYDTSAWNMTAANGLFLKIVTANGGNYTNKTDTNYVKAIKAEGEWATILFEKEFVEKCLFENGTKITFQFGISGAFSWTATPVIDGSLGFYLDDISYYNQLATPTGLSYNAGMLSWTAAENATSYVVEIGETEIPVTETSLNISSYIDGDTTVLVKAVAEGFADSEYAIQNVLVLKANELASFNSKAYESSIGVVAGETYKTFREAPTFAKDGAPEGTVTFAIRNDDYRNPHADWTNIAAFTVTLSNAINLESGNDGIVIKLYVSEATQTGKLRLELLNASKPATWNTTKSAAAVTIGEDGVKNTGWMELKVTNAQLAELGYKTGDTVLTFGLRNAANQSAKNEAHRWMVSIDYIEYYKGN